MANYNAVNAMWPDPMPVPSDKEAITGAKRLIRRAFALAQEDGVRTIGYASYVKHVRFRITRGRRMTWVRNHVWHVNPDESHRFGGWSEIVHSVSHWAIRRFWPGGDPHSPRHAWMENELATYAVANFLAGQLVRPTKAKPPRDVKAERASRVAARLLAWERKRKRAETAIRELRKKARYYQRALSPEIRESA